MRRTLLIAGAAALAAGVPALAKPGGGGGGGKPEKQHGGGGHGGGGHGGGGGKPEKHGGGGGKEHRFERGGGGGGGGGQARREFREERRFERQDRRDWARASEKRWEGARKRDEKFAKQERKGREGFAKAERKRNERFAKDDRKAFKAEAKRFERAPEVRSVRYEDRRLDGARTRYQDRDYGNRDYADRGFAGGCPPGLAKKGNGCLPPGQAKKMFAVGSAFPVAYYSGYNVPDEYRDWYNDSPDSYYRYDESGSIYQVDRGSGLIESIIPLLGGGFGLGQVLPAGYDAYNLPLSYRDDYVDSPDAMYRYGDDAIYQVDPQSQLIEGIVALLGGDLNVGQALPSGYDAYNLPMDYRDQYVDDANSMYRYADGNIYEIDPQSMIIEQIVAQLT